MRVASGRLFWPHMAGTRSASLLTLSPICHGLAGGRQAGAAAGGARVKAQMGGAGRVRAWRGGQRRAPMLSVIRCLATSPPPMDGTAKHQMPVVASATPADPTFRDVMKVLAKHVWPADSPHLRRRVAASMFFLISAKVANVQVPIIFKLAIDALNEAHVLANGELVLVPVGLLLSYGAARLSASLFKELQTAVFAKVSANAIREVGSSTFRHVLDLDLGYHSSRETGALTRYLDRGG